MGRYDLTDEQYTLIEPHLPSNTKKIGHPFGEHRPLINGIFWRLHTGAPWPDIPERYGNWKTIYDRYSTWCRDGTWDRVIHALQLKLDEHGVKNGGTCPQITDLECPPFIGANVR